MGLDKIYSWTNSGSGPGAPQLKNKSCSCHWCNAFVSVAESVLFRSAPALSLSFFARCLESFINDGKTLKVKAPAPDKKSGTGSTTLTVRYAFRIFHVKFWYGFLISTYNVVLLSNFVKMFLPESLFYAELLPVWTSREGRK